MVFMVFSSESPVSGSGDAQEGRGTGGGPGSSQGGYGRWWGPWDGLPNLAGDVTELWKDPAFWNGKLGIAILNMAIEMVDLVLEHGDLNYLNHCFVATLTGG